jgi:hypothetical protein
MTVNENIYNMFYKGDIKRKLVKIMTLEKKKKTASEQISAVVLLGPLIAKICSTRQSYWDVKVHNSRIPVTFLLFCCIMS